MDRRLRGKFGVEATGDETAQFFAVRVVDAFAVDTIRIFESIPKFFKTDLVVALRAFGGFKNDVAANS